MQNIQSLLVYLIIFFGVVNLIRMAVFLIGSDIYNLQTHLNRRKKITSLPAISIIIPAFNEAKSIIACVKSVLNSNYPRKLLQIIVVDDGSSDNTLDILEEYSLEMKINQLKIISQKNSGKANALNNGLKNYADGELVMCLDADSVIDKNALFNSVKYFRNPRVAAVASNVKIVNGKSILNFLQLFEYIIGHQLKKAQTVYNIEYIIGGVGSIFRRKLLKSLNYFDEDTVTEDIDMTMKILRLGNKKVRVMYASDVIAFTQGALTVKDLIRQRHRWKWGRNQTFFKNREMFFTRNKEFTKGFTWIHLPYAVYNDFAFFFEPLILSFMFYLIIANKDIFTLLSAMTVISIYFTFIVLGEQTLANRDKIKLIIFSPVLYFLFYILNFVEYVALIKALINLPNLRRSLAENRCGWTPIRKTGTLGTV